MSRITIVGGGLAGSEAALQLAHKGFEVDLYEMRPHKTTGAHVSGDFAEFVCSNSLGSQDETNASGQLKKELQMLDSFLIKLAIESQVPAGGALAIDRELFSQKVTELIESNPKINVIREEIKTIPKDGVILIASGPLTSDDLAADVMKFTGEQNLFFFDAIAPIVEKDSINFDRAFIANRYNKGDASYINCPMDKDEYLKFYDILTNAPKIELKSFEKNASFFESCLPIEVLASRGIDTLRYGPMKPVGLVDERTQRENYAVVQLRQDNKANTLYNLVGFQTNLKWPAQKELIHSIPGLENANIVRYGVMHRNTFINSPKVLNPTLQSKIAPNVFFAGQITGTEGYTEAIMSGLAAAINISRYMGSLELVIFPEETMTGALLGYIACSNHNSIQPINSNWGIILDMAMEKKIRKDKKLKNKLLGERGRERLLQLIDYINT